MLLRLLMVLFAVIIFYIGYYLYAHRTKDFMLFKASTNSILSKTLNTIGKILMIISIVTFLLGLSGNPSLILVALILGIFSTTGAMLVLLKFL